MSRLRSTSSASITKKVPLDSLNSESSRRRSQIASEIDEADDPLALYDRFVKWIFAEYPREHLASSGLIELLEEATRRYKSDSSYKSDLRYLKLWTLYASLVDKPSVVYKFILTNGIGTVYALLFEDYALTLERDGRCVIIVLPVSFGMFMSSKSLGCRRSLPRRHTTQGTASGTFKEKV